MDSKRRPGQAELELAHRATTYRVDFDGTQLALRIGEPCPALDSFLALHHANAWALITADNPRSQLLTASENQRRRNKLQQSITELGHPHYASRAEADAGNWPSEEGFLIVGLDAAVAIALARRFQQAAIVAGETGGPPRLTWID